MIILYRLVYFYIFVIEMSKAEETSRYIIETVAPIFNKSGYNGTSMSALTKATGLTKGAIYGNFENKEELALKAFNHNVHRVFNLLTKEVDKERSVIGKLKAMTRFYRIYPVLTHDLGGCPLLNVGVDANHQHEQLFNRVKDVNRKLLRNLTNLIQGGIDNNELKPSLDAAKYAGLFMSMIEGCIYMGFTLKDPAFIESMMDYLDESVIKEMSL
ncbi:MAG: TetR/AcrR family transcriptional regulator [Cyclobacteriaceae bacterium]